MQECKYVLRKRFSRENDVLCVHYIIKNTLMGVKAALSTHHPLPYSIFSFLTRDTVLYDIALRF